MHTHASLLAGVSSLRDAWQWEPGDRLVLSLPLFHVHGLCAGLFGVLTAGASAVVFDRFDESAILGAAPASTMFFGVPTMYHRLAASGRVSALSGLRLCVSGSAPLAPDLWHRLAEDGVVVLERYGMTETLLTLSNPLVGERRPGSVGLPLPGVEAALDDADEQGIGELLVRGASLCRGYWGRDAFMPGDWFATGDLVSVADDGYVTVRGRRTELIITGGHNVYPAEVEAVLVTPPRCGRGRRRRSALGRVGRDRRGLRGGRSRPGIAPGAGRGRARTVQVPARGAPDRCAAPQRPGQGGPGGASLTGAGPLSRPAPAVA